MGIPITYQSSEPSISTHLRHYREQLESGRAVRVSDIVNSYTQMQPLMHHKLATDSVDVDALNYAATRLPATIYRVRNVTLALSREELIASGIKVDTWSKVSSPNRRRIMYLDPTGTLLACLINSDSDIDDVVNNLLAYYIEHRKIGRLLNHQSEKFLANPDPKALGLEPIELSGLTSLFRENWDSFINSTSFELNFQITAVRYDRAKFSQNCHNWWTDISARSLILGFNEVPVYFVSSNSHSLVNIIGGFINKKQNYIFDYISRTEPDIYESWFATKRENNREQVNDFLYYLSSRFLSHNPEFEAEKTDYEKSLGLRTLTDNDRFPTDVQLIPLSAIANSTNLDPNIKVSDLDKLRQSKALIINIQYPLGLAAGYLLDEILNYFNNLRSVYVIGKAAILNGKIGDIQIPKSVFDETSGNTYNFENTFNKYFPFESVISTVMLDQKAVCVYGTFLENNTQMKNYVDIGLNIVEMESGHFLSALNRKYSQLNNLPIDVGIINYASDNPLVENLTKESLSVRSVESSYLSTLAVLQRIVDLETQAK
ncbi:hypothetical protein KBC75_05325 [Candidatus Shapirobacteria bacterium]|nr:hypothetical protein [Candidatus Shapirobacteria bacterium]